MHLVSLPLFSPPSGVNHVSIVCEPSSCRETFERFFIMWPEPGSFISSSMFHDFDFSS